MKLSVNSGMIVKGLAVLVMFGLCIFFFLNQYGASKNPTANNATTNAASLKAVGQKNGGSFVLARIANSGSAVLNSTFSPSQQLAADYQSSTDRRAFYDRALRQLEAGGLYFAMQTVTDCMAWVRNGKTNRQWRDERIAAIPATRPDREQIASALNRMHGACEGFDRSPVPFTVFRDWEARAESDPVLQTTRRFDKAFNGADVDIDTIRAVLSTASTQRDGVLLYDLLVKLSVANSERMVITVDGAALHPAYWEAFMLALPAAACQLGVECSQNARGLTNLCARGYCYADMYDYAQHALDSAQYEQFVRFHNITVQAISTGNFNAFGIVKRK